MNVGRISLSLGAAIGGGYTVYQGLKNYNNGKSIGKYQVAFGALAMVGGIYSLMTMNQTPIFNPVIAWPKCKDATLGQIKEACERALKNGSSDGIHNLPALDLEKHVASVEPDFGDMLIAGKLRPYPGCYVELTTEGHQLRNKLGLTKMHTFGASLLNGCGFFGVIRDDYYR